jgi:hypothetical protein
MFFICIYNMRVIFTLSFLPRFLRWDNAVW